MESRYEKMNLGKKLKQAIPPTNSQMDIILTKYIAMEGTLRLLSVHREVLKARFSSSFLRMIEERATELSCDVENKVAMQESVHYMQPIGEGGIYAALWELAKKLEVGIMIDGNSISICQETIEICEFFGVNPYKMASKGSVLMVTQNGERLQKALSNHGINSTMIGRTTGDNQKIIHRGEDIRFIDRPAPDELWKVLKKEE